MVKILAPVYSSLFFSSSCHLSYCEKNLIKHLKINRFFLKKPNPAWRLSKNEYDQSLCTLWYPVDCPLSTETSLSLCLQAACAARWSTSLWLLSYSVAVVSYAASSSWNCMGWAWVWFNQGDIYFLRHLKRDRHPGANVLPILNNELF